jgi:hypothetical protein
MMENRKYGRLLALCSRFSALLILAGVLPGARAQIFSQDLTMHVTTTTSDASWTSTEYYSKNAMRAGGSEIKDMEFIYRFDSQKVIHINHYNKTYSETTRQEMQESANQRSAKLAANPKQMEAMRKMMGPMPTSITVTPEGPGERIAGYPTQKYLIRGFMEGEIWAAPDVKLPAAYYDLMKAAMPSTNPLFDMKALYEEMKKIQGFPLKEITTMKMMNTEIKITKIVTSIEKGPVPASVFEAPTGYKTLNQLLGGK